MEQDDAFLGREIQAQYFPGGSSLGTLVITFPGDGEINFWTFAMVGISCTFLVFVGFSVFIMW